MADFYTIYIQRAQTPVRSFLRETPCNMKTYDDDKQLMRELSIIANPFSHCFSFHFALETVFASCKSLFGLRAQRKNGKNYAIEKTTNKKVLRSLYVFV